MRTHPTRFIPVAGRVGKHKPRRWATRYLQPWCLSNGRVEWIGVTRQKAGTFVIGVQPYRFGNPPILHTLPQWVQDMMKRKVPTSDQPGKIVQAGMASKIMLKHQNLVQHLAVAQYDDGTPRQPGIMILMTAGVNWRIILKDPDTSGKLVVTQETLDEVLTAADLLLGSPDTMWEIDQYERSSKKGRGKK